MLVAIVASLLLGLAGVGLGIAALRKSLATNRRRLPWSVRQNGTTISGVHTLAATQVSRTASAVDFLATGGSLHETNVETGTLSIVGWLAPWNTATVANGTYYCVVGVSYNADGKSTRSPSVTITDQN
jgi:hypothetical protein